MKEPASDTRLTADEAAVIDLVEMAHGLEWALREVVVGQEEVIRQALIALLVGGNALLEGVPGLGKTLLVRTLAACLRLSFARIQFTPDLMPADITGTTIVREDEAGHRTFAFEPGPLFAHLILADEINRATPKTQSALLEAMQEGTVTVGHQTHRLPTPFFVMATQNPLEMEGTYPLPEAQLDRFLMKILVPYPEDDVLFRIVEQTLAPPAAVPAPVTGADELQALMPLAKLVPIPQAVTAYAVALVTATLPDRSPVEPVRRYVRAGVSPRGLQGLILGSQVHALLDGRYNASIEDVRRLAHPVMRHRLFLTFAGVAEGLSADSLIDLIVEQVPSP